MERKLGRGSAPFGGGRLGPHLTSKVAWAEAYLRAKYDLHPSSRLATINMRENRGRSPLFGEEGAGSTSNTVTPWADAYLHTKWHLGLCSHLAAADMGRKLGGWVPSNTMWPGPRPEAYLCMPCFILIRQTVWPQYIEYTNVTDRQTGQRSDSIGRTVLQTVAQKTSHFKRCARTTLAASTSHN